MAEVTARGSCLCGAVSFQITGPLRQVIACHCTQCRKQSGHYWALSSAADEDFHLTNEDGLKWYSASDTAIRGFCATCGSTMFWKQNDENKISFSAGTLDEHPELSIAKHIFTDTKGDYYTLESKE